MNLNFNLKNSFPQDCHDSEKDGHHLMVNTETRFYYVSQSILSLMLHYKWRSFWLIAGQLETWANIVGRLKEQLDAANITINDEDIDDHSDFFMPGLSEEVYDKIIGKSLKRTRVYLFLGSAESLYYFTRRLYAKAGEDRSSYAVIAVDDGRNEYLNNKNFYLRRLEGNVSDEQRMTYIQSFKNVLIITQAKRNINNLEFEKKVSERNNGHPIYAYRYVNNSTKTIMNQFQMSDHFVARQAYQLYDATMIYGRAVMSLMATPGKDPENAYDVIWRLRCHEHESIQKEKIWIHENGQSESSFLVASLQTNDDEQWKIGIAGKFNKTDQEAIPTYLPEKDVDWMSGRVPESDPECGFDGEYCQTEEDDDYTIAVSVSVPISVFLIIVVTLFFGIRHCVYEKKLDRLAWKIERDDIQFLNEGQFRELTTPSRNRKKNSLNGSHYNYLMLKTDSQSDISHGPNGSEFLNIGFYRGAYVAVKELTRKHMELTRVLKKQMQLRKELTHENINRFIGACFEPPKIYIVTQYCPRKSLQDILRNEYAHLDNMFITSLVQDLIRGMTFIHESQFGYHGNLKSSNCLVDSRWTLKISDFGFSALGPPPCINFDDDKSFEGEPRLIGNRLNLNPHRH
ncbi:hypothetical protein Btru_070717 [Bulinus truncatus]|nr:hypothetical protein Btru_070717 [Bulinus truncatus]